MTRRQRRWHELTRNTRFILIVAGGVAVASLLWARWRAPQPSFTGWHRQVVSEHAGDPGDPGVPWVPGQPIPDEARLPDRTPPAARWAERLREITALPADQRRSDALKGLDESALPEPEKRLLGYWKAALFSAEPAAPLADWQREAESAVPPPWAAEWWADWLSGHDRFGEAVRFYLAEARAHGSERAALRALELTRHHSAPLELKSLLDDPVARLVPVEERIGARAACRDYPGLLRDTVKAQLESWPLNRLPVVLAGMTVWLAILVKTGGWPRRDWPWIVPALVAGALATTLTLAIHAVQEHFGAVKAGESPFGDAYYYIAGVGLREETSKILLFLALVPTIWRGGSDRRALMVASLVGLGFATEENGNYLAVGSFAAFGRLLTANFLHIALTGLLGLALWRLLRGARHAFEQFLSAFAFAVLGHGLYDYPWSHWMPATGLEVAAMVILCVIAYRYFAVVDEAAGERRPVVSPMAVFVIGSALLVGLAFNDSASVTGFDVALRLQVPEFLSTLPLAFLFIRQFRHV